MSRPNTNITICTNCGRPKAAPVTTQRTPSGAPWPTYWQDLAFVAKRVLGKNVATNEPVYVNGRRMGVPPIPAFLPPKEKITVNPADGAVPQNPTIPTTDEPGLVVINGCRLGVPPLPRLVLPKR